MPKDEEYKVCPHCGKAYKASKKYCPKCMKDDEGVYHGYTPMDEKKARKIKIVSSIVLTAIIIVVFILFYK